MNLFLITIAALCIGTPVYSLPDTAAPVDEKTLRKRAYQRIATLDKVRSPLEKGCAFVYHAYPLKGSYRAAPFDSAASLVSAFLSGRGSVTSLSTRGLFSCLSGTGESCCGARYLVLPLDVSSQTTRKKAVVQSFVNLDKEGNFIPSNTSRTLESSTIEITVRFVVVDLQTNRVVFETRKTAKAGSDDHLKEEFPNKGKKSSSRPDDQWRRCVLYIVEKVKETLAAEFR
jgi:hypothetical protein